MSYITLRGLRCATAPQGDDDERERHPEVRALARLEGCCEAQCVRPSFETRSQARALLRERECIARARRNLDLMGLMPLAAGFLTEPTFE
jgi:hypothetical protein